VTVLLFPSTFLAIGAVIFVFGFGATVLSICQKHRKAHLDGNLTHNELIRNSVLDTLGILLSMALAGWAGRTLTQIVTAPIANEIVKLIAGILVGILVGIGIGLLVKKTWGRLVKA
jgi:hypothetical protein